MPPLFFGVWDSPTHILSCRINLKSRADGAVDEEVDGRVEDHEEPGHGVELVELHRRDVLTAGFDAGDNQAIVKLNVSFDVIQNCF